MKNFTIKRFASVVQQPTNWFITACFCLCAYSAVQWMDRQPIALTAVADAAETSASVSSVSRSECVTRPESKSQCPSQTVLTPIEDLRVGMRVRADSPNGEVDDQFGDEVIPSEWRKLTLTSPKQNGTLSHITLLRPLEWIEGEKAVVDGHVYISVPECGIDGNALIHAIEPCPEIPDGEGQVITGTFRHQAEGGVELTIDGEPEPIRCTGNHPFWSEDKQQFVRADRLEIGERLRIEAGLTRLKSSASIAGQRTVHNIEVLQYHVYHVGATGVVVHNGDECPGILALSLRHLMEDFADHIEQTTGARVFTYWDYFKDARAMSQLEDRLDLLMDAADEVHINISEMSDGGTYKTIEDLIEAGMAGAFDGNVTNWEVWWALENFGDKVTWWQHGKEVTEDIFNIFLD